MNAVTATALQTDEFYFAVCNLVPSKIFPRFLAAQGRRIMRDFYNLHLATVPARSQRSSVV